MRTARRAGAAHGWTAVAQRLARDSTADGTAHDHAPDEVRGRNPFYGGSVAALFLRETRAGA